MKKCLVLPGKYTSVTEKLLPGYRYVGWNKGHGKVVIDRGLEIYRRKSNLLTPQVRRQIFSIHVYGHKAFTTVSNNRGSYTTVAIEMTGPWRGSNPVMTTGDALNVNIGVIKLRLYGRIKWRTRNRRYWSLGGGEPNNTVRTGKVAVTGLDCCGVFVRKHLHWFCVLVTGEELRVLITNRYDDPNAVSYTHLDVYKRQTLRCEDIPWKAIKLLQTHHRTVGNRL